MTCAEKQRCARCNKPWDDHHLDASNNWVCGLNERPEMPPEAGEEPAAT
jgi:hypothetical protein